MDGLASQIYTLIQLEGKSADKITHALATIGGGKMDVGIKRLADFYMKAGDRKGEKRGRKEGIAEGIGGTLSIFAIYHLIKFFKRKIKEKKEYKAEGEAILTSLERASIGNSECIIVKTDEKNRTNIDTPTEGVVDK